MWWSCGCVSGCFGFPWKACKKWAKTRNSTTLISACWFFSECRATFWTSKQSPMIGSMQSWTVAPRSKLLSPIWCLGMLTLLARVALTKHFHCGNSWGFLDSFGASSTSTLAVGCSMWQWQLQRWMSSSQPLCQILFVRLFHTVLKGLWSTSTAAGAASTCNMFWSLPSRAILWMLHFAEGQNNRAYEYATQEIH